MTHRGTFWRTGAGGSGPRIPARTSGSTPRRAFWDHRYAAFAGPRVARWVADGLWPVGGGAPIPVPPGTDWPARFDTLLGLIHRGDRWATARAIHSLEGILLELAEAHAAAPQETPTTAPWLADVLERLNTAANDGDTFTPVYETLARDAGMTVSTLRRRFRQATGTPIHNYVVQARLARARTLLGDTDLPVKAIAEKLGYSDVYFFTRQFRRLVGVPPAAYRRSRQG